MYHQFIELEFLEGHNTRSLKLKHNKPRKPGRGGRVACESEKVVLSLEGGFYRTVKTHKASKEMSYVIDSLKELSIGDAPASELFKFVLNLQCSRPIFSSRVCVVSCLAMLLVASSRA